jgi:hypothetical protein
LKPALTVGAIAAIAAVFLGFAGDGLAAYFTPDDMMNLYGAWFGALGAQDRPLGALVYRAIFTMFGLTPLPFRILCFVLLGLNLALLYAVCARLSGSREVGVLACLMGAYHAHLADLYYSTGTLYDLLCFLFYWSAVLVWTGRRAWWAALPLYLCALWSKEMAVTLPLVLLAYDLASRRAPRWRVLVPMALLTLAFVWRKMAGPASMAANPAYLPHLSWAALLQGWQHYAFDLFYGSVAMTPARVLLLWLLVAAAVALLRGRDMAVAAVVIWAGLLPVIFIATRGFYVVYLTLPGWYLLAAKLLVRATSRVPLRARAAVVFAGLALVLLPLHAARKEKGRWWVAEAHASVRNVLEPLRPDPLPHAARVLLLDDPFPKDDYILTFIFRLRYRDEQLRVDRAKVRPPDYSEPYQRIYRIDGGRLTRL